MANVGKKSMKMKTAAVASFVLFGLMSAGANAAVVAVYTATPNPAAPLQSILFNGTQSVDTNPAATLVSYNWQFGDGTAGSGLLNSHAYSLFGTYTATLIVLDSLGSSGVYSNTIFVNAGNLAPIANAGGPYNSFIGTPITLSGALSTDPNLAVGDKITLGWDLDNNGTFTDAAGFSPTAVFNSVGTQTIAVKATDIFGLTSIGYSTVSVAASPVPIPSAAGLLAVGLCMLGGAARKKRNS